MFISRLYDPCALQNNIWSLIKTSCPLQVSYCWYSFKLLISNSILILSLTFVFLFDQVTDDLVVEILNMFPFNALPLIFFLLRLECQFYE